MNEPGTALYTDRYELTMLGAALADGTAHRRCTFEVFARSLPQQRRYGVVCGIHRVLHSIRNYRFHDDDIAYLQQNDVINATTAKYLAEYQFRGDIDAYPDGEVYFPGSPILSVTGTFAECVILETLILSILNHDSAVSTAAARMSTAASSRPLIEMGTRRTHEVAATAAAAAAYVGGFSATSNLYAGREYDLPTTGTMAHAFVLLHDSEEDAFRSQLSSYGPGTTLLVDTFDILRAVERAVEIAGPQLHAIRIDSGDLGVLAEQARHRLNELGARETKIVLSGDLDEYAIAGLRGSPVDVYGVGTSVVTGSGAPAASMVYKLVEVEGRPVVKRSTHKTSRGGRKYAYRSYKPTGTATHEVVTTHPYEQLTPDMCELSIPVFRSGEPCSLATLSEAREHLRDAVRSIPWEGLSLLPGEPALNVRFTES